MGWGWGRQARGLLGLLPLRLGLRWPWEAGQDRAPQSYSWTQQGCWRARVCFGWGVQLSCPSGLLPQGLRPIGRSFGGGASSPGAPRFAVPHPGHVCRGPAERFRGGGALKPCWADGPAAPLKGLGGGGGREGGAGALGRLPPVSRQPAARLGGAGKPVFPRQGRPPGSPGQERGEGRLPRPGPPRCGSALARCRPTAPVERAPAPPSPAHSASGQGRPGGSPSTPSRSGRARQGRLPGEARAGGGDAPGEPLQPEAGHGARPAGVPTCGPLGGHLQGAGAARAEREAKAKKAAEAAARTRPAPSPRGNPGRPPRPVTSRALLLLWAGTPPRPRARHDGSAGQAPDPGEREPRLCPRARPSASGLDSGKPPRDGQQRTWSWPWSSALAHRRQRARPSKTVSPGDSEEDPTAGGAPGRLSRCVWRRKGLLGPLKAALWPAAPPRGPTSRHWGPLSSPDRPREGSQDERNALRRLHCLELM